MFNDQHQASNINSSSEVTPQISSASILRQYSNATTSEQAFRRAIASDKGAIPKTHEEFFLQRCNLNAPDTNAASKRTALHIAIHYNKPYWVKKLLEHNVYIHLPDAQGKTAVCYASASSNEEIRKLVFSYLAKQTMEKVKNKYRIILEKEARMREIDEDEKTDKCIQCANEICSNLLSLFGFIFSMHMSKFEVEKYPNSAESHLKVLQSIMRNATFLLEIQSIKISEAKFTLTAGLCQPTTYYAVVDLLKTYPCIKNGILPITIITQDANQNSSKGSELLSHMFFLIDGSENRIGNSTVLCNALRAETIENITAIKEYFYINARTPHYNTHYNTCNTPIHFQALVKYREELKGIMDHIFYTAILGENTSESFLFNQVQALFRSSTEEDRTDTFEKMERFQFLKAEAKKAFLQKLMTEPNSDNQAAAAATPRPFVI